MSVISIPFKVDFMAWGVVPEAGGCGDLPGIFLR